MTERSTLHIDIDKEYIALQTPKEIKVVTNIDEVKRKLKPMEEIITPIHPLQIEFMRFIEQSDENQKRALQKIIRGFNQNIRLMKTDDINEAFNMTNIITFGVTVDDFSTSQLYDMTRFDITLWNVIGELQSREVIIPNEMIEDIRDKTKIIQLQLEDNIASCVRQFLGEHL